jgi:hypothetical protein
MFLTTALRLSRSYESGELFAIAPEQKQREHGDQQRAWFSVSVGPDVWSWLSIGIIVQ